MFFNLRYNLIPSIDLLVFKPQYTWPGLGIVLLDIPVYFVWEKKKLQ
jgi:basic amino acid/polyamine antiporter, APA family